ncbi:MAG: hypothetical protein MJZ57_04015 [Bacteroidales bacterium]|nr:hypothetical protein [Bacteroidales bacterium]
MRKLLIVIGLLIGIGTAQAQMSKDSIANIFYNWNTRMDQLNTQDPELISLHYLFLQDVRNEISAFQNKCLSQLSSWTQLDYYQTQADFRKVVYRADTLNTLLCKQKGRVDVIFFQQAEEELLFGDTLLAMYNLDRALQYNKYQPDALLMKAELMLEQELFQESVDLIHLLYTKAELDEKQEMAVSDFTIVLYDKLYSRGNALVKNGHSADALEAFLALEQFCSNMPSGYCNDDYYRGILLSREGVYESYIAIAKEAEKRHNIEMAKKFYRYAEEYKKSGE